MSKYIKPGTKVWIKDLNTVGTVVSNEYDVNYYGKALVTIETPEGPRFIDWVERNYELVTGIARILFMILQLLRSGGK